MEGDIIVNLFKWGPNDEIGVLESVKVHAGKLVWLTPSYECELLLFFFASF